MAAVENMGEVDEVHSKGEGEVITNGSASSDNEASASPQMGKGAVEPMEVDEEDSQNSADGNSADGNSADGNSADGNSADGNSLDDNSADGNSVDGSGADGNSADGSVPQPDGEQSDRESSNDEESRGPGDLAVDENTNNNSKDEVLDRTDSGDEVCEKENPPSENENETNSDDDEELDSKGETEHVNTETLNDLIKDSDNDEEMDVINDLAKSKDIIELNETDEDDEKVQDGKENECETIELNDAGDTDNEGDVILIESPKENGGEKRKLDISEVIDLDVETTPVKKLKVNSSSRSITPRRSSRNLNKQKSYVEEDKEEEEDVVEDQDISEKKTIKFGKFESEEESDIEEVLPEDPLAMNNEKLAKSGMIIKPVTNSSTIVVKDTKKLVEIATKSSPAAANVGKKEPTLVIIDTNSILSGRGPVPIGKSPKTGSSSKPVPSSKPISGKQQTASGKQQTGSLKQQTLSISNKQSPLTISKQPPPLSSKGPLARPNSGVTIAQSNYPTLLPVALPAQGMYPANMRATITPIPLSTAISKPQQPPPLLPTLTDDMFVVEAPSFIVPYVYEKPPKTEFKEFVQQVAKDIADQKKREEEEKIAKEEEEKRVKEEEKKAKEDEEKKDTEENDEKDENKEKEENKEKVDNDSEKKDDNKEVKNETSSEKEKPKENEDALLVKNDPIADKSSKDKTEDPKKIPSYFGSPLGKFFIDIGMNLVQEFVQNDLLKQQKRKRERERGQNSETNRTIQSLLKNLEYSKESNSPFKMPMKKCEFCHFKSESQLVLAYHLETPHMKNYVYKCNFCSYEVRSPHDILFHMEAEHAVRGRLERAPSFHQCSNCPFEDNQKGKLSRHLVACARKFKPERNLEPPIDWEPPAKIPRVPKMRQQGLNATAAAYQAMNKNSQYQFLSKMQLQSTAQANAALSRGRGRPTLANMPKGSQALIRPGPAMVYKQTMSGGSVLVPTNYQLGNQVFQVLGRQELGGKSYMAPLPGGVQPGSASLQNQQQQNQNASAKKPVHQPSISITPLPRASTSSSSAGSAPPTNTAKPGDTNSKNSFVICEICDGYIKDLEQLRNHMQWIHKIKIHPKMIYNRPPLNCQKCQFRFFTDQGLERHLLGSHGLVTSSMQDAANKSKDAGRCPVCGRVYQWKLLNHVARDHNMTLKPAHLSYKCTVCTATFGMYKQFENHVYSAHSVVAKRGSSGGGSSNSEKKPASSGLSAALSNTSVSSKSGNDMIKPLKINDEITIIPQPNKAAGAADGSSSASTPAKSR